jgi:hypothetical protein
MMTVDETGSNRPMAQPLERRIEDPARTFIYNVPLRGLV